MGITGMNSRKCEQRNRINAHKFGLNTMEVVMLADASGLDDNIQFAKGNLPTGKAAAMAKINALLPLDAEPLDESQVWIHYMIAANNNFVGDRYMFIGTSTLKNIAMQAGAGVAFMNSHRFGHAMSSESELPFGKTFAGRWQKDGDGFETAALGIYMMRDVTPNGDNGPSTNDMHDMIVGGTVADVSVTLYGGTPICDVCGLEVVDDFGWEDPNPDACPHAPGTTNHMNKAEIKKQLARGVRGGCASYTLNDANFLEVSAVYDGAVPGAGFSGSQFTASLNDGVIEGSGLQKVLTLARQHRLSSTANVQARSAYERLLTNGDKTMLQKQKGGSVSTRNITNILRSVGLGSRQIAAVLENVEDEEDDEDSGLAVGRLLQVEPVNLRAQQEFLASVAVPVTPTADQLRIEALEKTLETLKLAGQSEMLRACVTDAVAYANSVTGKDGPYYPRVRTPLIIDMAQRLFDDRGLDWVVEAGEFSAEEAHLRISDHPAGVRYSPASTAKKAHRADTLRALLHSVHNGDAATPDPKVVVSNALALHSVAPDTHEQKQDDAESIDESNLSSTPLGRRVLEMRREKAGGK